MPITITVREYGGAYIARGNGKTSSSTNSARCAAQNLAMKLAGFPTRYKDPKFIPFDKTGIKLTWTAGQTYMADWEVQA